MQMKLGDMGVPRLKSSRVGLFASSPHSPGLRAGIACGLSAAIPHATGIGIQSISFRTTTSKYVKMKKTLTLLTLFSTSFLLQAQIALEHTYFAGSTMGSVFSDDKQPLMVELEVEGHKYVIIDRVSELIEFYNLDHSLFLTISFSGATVMSNEFPIRDILYISQHLFDLDDGIEFMFTSRYWDGANAPDLITQIVDQDGSIAFTAMGEAPLIKANFAQQQLPIYNTASGTKMILSTATGDARVYGLTGSLHVMIEEDLDEFYQLGWPYPNPTSTNITIPYDLPGNVSSGMIKVYDSSGKCVESHEVRRGSNRFILSTERYQAGSYFYEVWTSKDERLGSRQILKVE